MAGASCCESNSFIMHTIDDESSPPDKQDPTGTSARSLNFTESINVCLNFSQASSNVPMNGAAFNTYQDCVEMAWFGANSPILFKSIFIQWPGFNCNKPSNMVS